ncbi:MAG: amidohydrolase family protein [Dehalococcoidia bacterium]
MYDLLIKGGRVVDGSGMPSYHADVAVKDGKIVEIGQLTGQAAETIDAAGRVVAPGFIDNHCHFDAQVTWDPLCTFSPNHGVTTVIFGNCSLALAPVHPGDRESLAMMLSRVEAIPMESLRAGVKWNWETFPEYLDVLDQRLGVNAGAMMGHSAVRRYVMGEDAYEREQATGDELEAMKAIIREGITAGGMGLSFDRNTGHLDLEGRPIPGIVAPIEEIYELASALNGLSAGVLQCGSAYPLEIRDGFATKMGELSGRPVVYNQLVYSANEPDRWRTHLDIVEQRVREGRRVYPVVNPRPQSVRFTMKNGQIFDRLPTWRPIMMKSTEEKIADFSDPAVRVKLHAEAVDGKDIPATALPIMWDRIHVTRAMLPKNKEMQGKSIAKIAEDQGKDVLDAFLDLVIEEDLDTSFLNSQSGGDDEAMATMLRSPYTVIGLSDAGAHVVFEAGYGYSSIVLGHWVRERQVLTMEEAIRKLTFMQASLYGIDDRGLLRPGMAADIVVFDPDTIAADEPEEVYDLPEGLMRLRQTAQGVHYTIVNGQVLMVDGEHTGAYPGRVMRGAAHAAATA